MRFLLNGNLSFYDTVRLTGFACYADTLDACPERDTLLALDLNDPVTAVPLPAANVLFLSAMASMYGLHLLGIRKRKQKI